MSSSDKDTDKHADITTKSSLKSILIPSAMFFYTMWSEPIPVGLNRGGATVLKVGGTNSASGASRKFFFDPPHFLASGGDKILLT